MKVVFTPGARADLDDILSFITTNYPGVVDVFERRLNLIMRRIEMWPDSAAAVADREAVRVVPLVRYPYKIFYRVTDVIEILHIHHTARKPLDG
jgi:toxin ParE1/3/4